MDVKSLAFMQLFTERCSKFFTEMSDICDAYNKQFGGNAKSNPKQKLSGDNLDSESNSKKGSKSKKKKEARDPNLPKQPLTAFIIYFKEKQKKLKEKYPELNVTEISKLVSKEWNALSPSKQQPYHDQAVEKRQEYIKQMKEYKKNNPELNVKIPGENTKKKQKQIKSDEKENSKTKKNILQSSDESSDKDESE